MPSCCHSCAAPLPSGSVAGVCPVCLLTGAQAMPGTAEDPPDAVLRQAGGYDLLERVGRGGMGVVYRARQRSLGRTVAVKMISAGELAAPEVLRRFRLEAEAAAHLHHPGIVGIHEVGEHEGLPFFSMDYVDGGKTLATLIAEKPLPPHAAAACLEKVARAVHHAHEHGVLHRDLKPSNILLDQQGEPRVADFGLARMLGTDSSLTLSKNALGSPAYMPPEQAGGRSAEAGPASDVYSLGAVLYHCLTGRPPFAGDSVQTVLIQVREADPVLPRRLNASIPRDLENIALKCLEKSPARRYPSAAALADDLGRWLRGEPVVARPVGTLGRLRRWTLRHPGVAALLAALALALTGGVILTLYSNRRLAAGKQDVENALREKSSALDGQTRALADALISRAESAVHATGRPGQRTAALDAVRQVTALPLTPEETFRARNAAITALALPEASFVPQASLPPPGDWTMAICDPSLKVCARAEYTGKVAIHTIGGDKPPVTFDLAPRRIDCLIAFDATGTLLAFRYDKSKLGVLHTGTGLLPFRAEPWPAPVRFRPCQAAFGRWRMAARVAGLPLGAGIPVICWAAPDGSVRIADPVFGLSLASWTPPQEVPPSTALQMSPDGKMVAVARDLPPRLEILQVPGGSVIHSRELPAPVNALRWVNWSGRIALGFDTGRVQVVEPLPDTRFPVTRIPGCDAHTLPVVSVEFCAGGLLSSSEDGTTRFWDRQSPTAQFDFAGALWRAEVDAGGWRAGALLQGGTLGMLEFKPGEVVDTGGNPVYGEALGAPCVMPNGRGIALLHREGIEFHHTVKYGPYNRVALEPTSSAVAAPDSSWLLAGQTDRLSHVPLRWPGTAGMRSGVPAEVLSGLRHVSGLAMNGEASLLAMAEEKAHRVTVRPLLDGGRKTGAVITEVTLPNPMACALSPDGRWVAAGSQVPQALILQPVGQPESGGIQLPVAAARNWHPAFSSNGRWLAVSGRTCQLFAAGTWEPGPPLDLPFNGADHHGAAFFCPPAQPDRCLLAVVAADREVHLFRLFHGPPARAEKVAVLRLPGQPFVSLPAFDSAGGLTVALPRASLATWSLPALVRHLKELSLSWN